MTQKVNVMIYKGVATFVGPDGKFGFEQDRGYKVTVKNRSGIARFLRFPGAIILRTADGEYCTYDTVEELLKDWGLRIETNK